MADDPRTVGDWYKPDETLLNLPRRAWVWEFRRMSPNFRAELDALQTAVLSVEVQDRFHFVRLGREPDANASCVYATDADESAHQATVVWNIGECPAALRAIAVPVVEAGSAVPFDVSALPQRTTLAHSPKGEQYLVIQDGPKSIQLNVSGASLLTPVALLVDTACRSEMAPDQGRALRAVQGLRQTGHMPAAYFPPEPRARSYATKLKALDLWRNGASEREIAIELFGRKAVQETWKETRHLRDRVRYAVASGRAMMERGYRVFLREP